MALSYSEALALVRDGTNASLGQLARDRDGLRLLLASSEGRARFAEALSASSEQSAAEAVLLEPDLAGLTIGDGRTLGSIAANVTPRSARLVFNEPALMSTPGVAAAAMSWPGAVAHLAARPHMLRRLPADAREVLRARREEIVDLLGPIAVLDPALAADTSITGEPLIHSAVKGSRRVATRALREPAVRSIVDAYGETVASLATRTHPGLGVPPSRAAASESGREMRLAARRNAILNALQDPALLARMSREDRTYAAKMLPSVARVIAPAVTRSWRLSFSTVVSDRPLLHELAAYVPNLYEQVMAADPLLATATDKNGRTLQELCAPAAKLEARREAAARRLDALISSADQAARQQAQPAPRPTLAKRSR